MKVFLNFAPVFLDFQIALCRELVARGCRIGGYIGGSIKYFHKLNSEIDGEFTYTHFEEKKWVKKELNREKLEKFIDIFGHETINEIIIADRQVGNGYVSGGTMPDSPLLNDIRSDKQAYIKYITSMLDFLWARLSLEKPDVFVGYAVAGSYTLAIYHICKKLGITFLKITSTRIKNQHVLDDNPYDNFSEIQYHFNNAVPSRRSLAIAKTYLDEFRKKPFQPGYQKGQNAIYKDRLTVKHQIKLWLKVIKSIFMTSNNFYHIDYRRSLLYELNVIKKAKKGLKNAQVAKVGDIGEDCFYYFPLHVDPEASTMVVSPMITNQLYVLEYISKILPINEALVVKEHVTMIGKRPDHFYEKINSLPRVYLIHHQESSFKLIKKSKAVITITGTSGMEALFLGKPAIFLGKFIYSFLNKGFVETNGIESITKALHSISKIQKTPDELIIKLIATIYDRSFDFNSSMIWSGKGSKYINKKTQVINDVVNHIYKR